MNRYAPMPALAATLAVICTSPAHSQQRYVARETWTVGAGDYILDDGVPGCGNSSVNVIEQAAQALTALEATGVYGALGSVLQTAAQTARPQVGGFVGQVLDSLYGGGRFANCVPVSVVIPATASIVSYEFTAGDQTGSRDCVWGGDCAIGWSRFDPPQVTAAGGSKIISSLFRNWSNDRTRTATMTVTFTN